MILTAIIYTIYAVIWLITAPLRVLPDVSLPDIYISSISNASGYITPINNIIPIDTILNILGLFILIEIGYYTYKGIMWLIKRLPTQS